MKLFVEITVKHSKQLFLQLASKRIACPIIHELKQLVEEPSDSDDPLSRKQSWILTSKLSSKYLLAGIFFPDDLATRYDLGIAVILILFSLFVSGLRAAYTAVAALENPWQRNSESSGLVLSRLQNFTLSLIQWLVTLIAAIVLANSLNISNLDSDVFGIYTYFFAIVAVWIWLDSLARYQISHAASGFINFASGASNLLFRLFTPIGHTAYKLGNSWGIVENEVEEHISVNGENKTDEEEETDLLKGLANFRQSSARKAMQPRMNITAFDIEMDFHELMDKINKSGYSRVPVFREDLDHIEGILNVKDLLPFINRDEKFKWQQLIRPVFFIPESKKLEDLMKEFQSRRVHMAIVVDEYGGTGGLITLEDIIEEIFGDINDEYDEDEVVNYTRVNENTYVFEAKVLISELVRLLDLPSDYFEEIKGGSESLAGLLLEMFSRLPRTGETVSFKDVTFKVQSADKRRIKKVRILID